MNYRIWEFLFAPVILFAISLPAFSQNAGSQRATASPAYSLSAEADKSVTPRGPALVTGAAQPLGKGAVRPWVTLDRDGNPTAIGVTFDEAALDGLPADLPHGQHGTEHVLALPPQAAPFEHVMINWNPHGHEPDHIYTVQHFDFHFYLIGEPERTGITAQGDDLIKAQRRPSAEFVPEGYVYAPNSEVPRMGSHWVDPVSHEFHGHAFTKTMLWGSYDGRIIFIEPMITRAYLLTKPNVTEPLKLPARYLRPGYYPTQYSVKYDAEKKEYTVALEGMTLR
jgi:Domain of unknown function (DUF5602)